MLATISHAKLGTVRDNECGRSGEGDTIWTHKKDWRKQKSMRYVCLLFFEEKYSKKMSPL